MTGLLAFLKPASVQGTRRVAAGLLLLVSLSAAADDTLRCGAHLVGPGDRMFEVRELCGEPDIKVLLVSVLTAHYLLPYEEEWQYNFGPQKLMRFLRFRNGELTSIETGPYGFTLPAKRCQPMELTEGMSTLELLSRCGEPALIERRISEEDYRVGVTGPFYPAGTALEDWIYDFDANYFRRIATVVDGRVIRVENTKRHG
jgi:hypothetical protein